MFNATSVKVQHRGSLHACPIPSGTCGVYVLHGNWLAADHSLLLHLFNACIMLGGLYQPATACTVYTFTIVHVVDLQVMCEPGPDCTGGHALFSKCFGASPKGPNYIVGDWLSGIFIGWHSKR